MLAVAAAVVVAVTVAISVVVLRPHDDHGNRVRTTSAPLTGYGAEVPLEITSPPQAAIAGMQRYVAGTVSDAHAVAIRVPDGTVITKWTAQVNGSPFRCVAGGHGSSCGDIQSPPPGTVKPENVIELGDDKTTLLLWIDLPPGTAYTTLTMNGTTRWQRPVDDMSVFSLPAVNGTPVRFTALNADGHELVAFDHTSTNGLYIADWPPWWDLDATLRWCNEAPLIDVERKINGGQSDRFRAFFPGMGLIDIGVRDACIQEAPLRPAPDGHIFSELTLRDGKLSANYFEKTETQGKAAPIDQAEAIQRIAADRKHLRQFCATDPTTQLGCERGG